MKIEVDLSPLATYYNGHESYPAILIKEYYDQESNNMVGNLMVISEEGSIIKTKVKLAGTELNYNNDLCLDRYYNCPVYHTNVKVVEI
jgi:hypothetical protein